MPDSPALVFVPAAASGLGIVRGSGIVGHAASAPRITIDYEGAIFGQANLARYADRVFHAYDRQQARYPTVARVTVRPDELVPVGWWDAEAGRVFVFDERRPLLEDWLGVGVNALDAELERTR